MDKLTKEQRSKNMKAVKSKNTKLEERVTTELWKKGFRYRKNNKKLFGKPDISIEKYKIVIFIDSCFWHGCRIHGSIPETNREFWINKINNNIKRDIQVTEYYKDRGWNILRIWEHDIKCDNDKVIKNIEDFILKVKNR
ncbi:very short patch repair endonuclease [Caldifermentibacillus hisashii]|uniref:very short patch repair endonuclease n=1 Tax=Bacillaceae TaxID=186817 RepID=UPI00203E3333|nr:very short patch repair endonuclease [Caldibacillus thermoamylovorans]MCM3799363.1 very short patch repair endonuclease [Caldibacillus thermoamylovorans]